MKRYISIILGILTSLSISAATFPTEGFGSEVEYGDFNVEDYGSDEVGATIPFDGEAGAEEMTFTVTKSNGAVASITALVYSDQVYNDGDVITSPYFGTRTLSSVVHETGPNGEDVTYSVPGYLFPVNPITGQLDSLGGADVLFKMPLEENLAVALMLIMMAAAYGVFRLRKKYAELA